jgi:hypothetical protein
VRERVAPGVQPGRPHDDRAHPGLALQVGQLVGQRGQLAQLQHVVRGHGRRAEALRRGDPHGLGRGHDLVGAEIEAGEDDRLAVEALRDVETSVIHVFTVSAAYCVDVRCELPAWAVHVPR